ncbi:MAG: CMGC protein kinase [Amphiamblys sp. WSBS2006]|nr:MAG: CMGC protein kinase [Amphiamblys sp. WSBS2006]
MRKGLVAAVFPLCGDGDNDGVPVYREDDYENLGRIWGGDYSVVHKIRNKETKEICALKTVKISSHARREIGALKRLDHENVVKMIAKSGDAPSGPFHIVLEHMPLDLLRAFKTRKRRAKIRKNKRKILRQVLEGLKHIHSRGIEHGDIYPRNILIDPETMAVKICDFGGCAHNPSERNNDLLCFLSTMVYLYNGDFNIREYNKLLDVLTEKETPTSKNTMDFLKKAGDITPAKYLLDHPFLSDDSELDPCTVGREKEMVRREHRAWF